MIMTKAIEISQTELEKTLRFVGCASSTSGALFEPGLVHLEAAGPNLTAHIQSRYMVANCKGKVMVPVPDSYKAIVNYNRLLGVVRSHPDSDKFTLNFSDEEKLYIKSNIGQWSFITTDLDSYFRSEFDGTKIGKVSAKDFGMILDNASMLCSGSTKSNIVGDIELKNKDGVLSASVVTNTTAGSFSCPSSNLTKEFSTQIRSWTIKKLKFGDASDVNVALNERENVLIFKTKNGKIVVVTASSMQEEDDSPFQNENSVNNKMTINRADMIETLSRLEQSCEGILNFEMKSQQSVYVWGSTRVNDGGGEAVVMNLTGANGGDAPLTKMSIPTKLLKSMMKIDPSLDELSIGYGIESDGLVHRAANFKGTFKGIGYDIIFAAEPE